MRNNIVIFVQLFGRTSPPGGYFSLESEVLRGATPGMKKHKFSTGVWKTVLQNTNRPCGVGSHGRFAFLGALMDQVSRRRHAHRRFSISRQLWVVRQLLSKSLCRFSHSGYGSVRERQSLRAARRWEMSNRPMIAQGSSWSSCPAAYRIDWHAAPKGASVLIRFPL